MPVSVGDKLGPYEILEPIGAGGMGEVYKARDTRLDRTVAIKVSKAKFSEVFEREAGCIAALNHPHICQLYDVGPDYLVMEYIDGAPLKGPLPLDQAMKYAGQICDALDAAHKKGITHRDLKPANVMVTKAGVKLLDFGLARIAADGDETVTMAATGTRAYMSPEQWESKAGDARSDIYAFGCVLYEMVTGKRATQDRCTVEPLSIDHIIKRCLEKDPDERWQSVKDVRHAMESSNRAHAETAIVEVNDVFAKNPRPGEADFGPGALIGPYKLVTLLGEGGMGVVYRAQQLQPIQRDVALKIIKPGMDTKQVIARFENERQTLALMGHPNIARVFDAGVTLTRRPYFVMELVDGIPIGRYCDSQRMSVRARIELFLDVCKAIQHAHQKGIIHRDIKPSNLLVAAIDGKPLTKVIDFGLAKALNPDGAEDATEMMTEFGVVMGTLAYMSPEQADMVHRDIDTRSDIYSLGAVLYELLTGATPLGRERLAKISAIEALRRVREEEPLSPSARVLQSTVPDAAVVRQTDPARLPKLLRGELDWIVTKALEKDPARRYQTASALAADLERYLEGEPVEAGRPSVAYRVRKFVLKHRLWLGAAAVFTALLVAGVIVSTWMALRATRAEQEARAVNSFLQRDLLAQASASNQARPGTKPDPDLKVRTALDRAAARIEGKFRGQPLVEASIRQTIGSTYLDLGLYPEGQRQVERALDLRQRVLGERHPDTLHSMIQLVELYRLQGNYAQAEPLNIKVVEIQQHVLGADHPDTLEAMHDLAILDGYLNKYAEAEALFMKVLDAQRRVLGEQHSSAFETMHDLATLYQRQGNYTQAEPLYIKTMEISRRVLGEEHPDTLVSMSGVAVVYQMEGKYAQAEPLEKKVLEAQRRVLGEEHLFTLNTANHLASMYSDQGKYTTAEALYRQTLETQRRVLGEEHPETLITMAGLAGTYRKQGNYARAEPLYTKTLEIQSRVLGEDFRDTRATTFNLAELYRLEGRYARAEPLFKKVLETRRRLVGPEHPETLATMNGLATLYLDEGSYMQAELLARETFADFEKNQSDVWERFHSQALLGASLAGQKKYAEAGPLLLAGYGGMLAKETVVPAVNRLARQQAANWIARLYRDWGRPEKGARKE